MWTVSAEHASENQFRKFGKRHPDELASMASNLETVVAALNRGVNLKQVTYGFWRAEKARVYRIAQTGLRGAKESRLYVFPDVGRQVMYILGVGTKESQRRDVDDAVRRARQAAESGGQHNE
jgi:hypothetical protein